ncbi:MAG: hypothetical protein ACOX0D_03625 [Sphaerochaeta sp.]
MSRSTLRSWLRWRGGKNHLLLFNDIAEAHDHIDHNGLIDVYASGTWKSKNLTANAILNVPFTKEFALATVKGETQERRLQPDRPHLHRGCVSPQPGSEPGRIPADAEEQPSEGGSLKAPLLRQVGLHVS